MNSIMPRPIYRIFLLMAAILIGHYVWSALPEKILIYISSLLGTFTLFIANFSWTFKDKVDQALSGETSNSANFKKVRELATSLIERSNFETGYILIASLAVFSPVICAQLEIPMYEWIFVVALVGTVEAIYSYLRIQSWLNQVNGFKDVLVYEAKLEIERADLIERIGSSINKIDKKSGK